jgi:hypothetical protein
MVWVGADGGAEKTLEHEPGASPTRKLETLVLSLLPIEGLL